MCSRLTSAIIRFSRLTNADGIQISIRRCAIPPQRMRGSSWRVEQLRRERNIITLPPRGEVTVEI